jgi:hypothetical protein
MMNHETFQAKTINQLKLLFQIMGGACLIRQNRINKKVCIKENKT